MKVFTIIENYAQLHNFSEQLHASKSYEVFAHNAAESVIDKVNDSDLVLVDIWLGRNHPLRMTAGELLRSYRKENRTYPILLLANEKDKAVLRNFGSFGNHPILLWEEINNTEDLESLINGKFEA